MSIILPITQQICEDTQKTLFFRDKLVSINEDDFRGTFKSREEDDYAFDYACILPVDKVIEVEPEKTYRALKSIPELYELIYDSDPERDNSYYIVIQNSLIQ